LFPSRARANLGLSARPVRHSLQESPTMKKLSLLLVATSLYVPLPAHAQQLDLATITCQEFINSDKQTIGMILMWLEGYYSDQDAKPIVDFDKMKTNGGKLGEYCGKNPGHSLITAADDVMGN
jgi:acid stress chaperone HdeB